MSQQFNALHDAVLTKRKAAYAMIASWTEPAGALIALNHRGILCVIATVHHFLRPFLSDCWIRFQYLRPTYSGLSVDHLSQAVDLLYRAAQMGL